MKTLMDIRCYAGRIVYSQEVPRAIDVLQAAREAMEEMQQICQGRR